VHVLKAGTGISSPKEESRARKTGRGGVGIGCGRVCELDGWWIENNKRQLALVLGLFGWRH
jgi:hypothetical protein